ncbi:MAG: FAD:protein FMN transferase [Glaciecola sp.]
MNIRLLLILGMGLLLQACTQPVSPLQSISGQTMGTTYSVKYVSNAEQDAKQQNAEFASEITSLLVDINQLMSTYIPDSELSLLNKADAGESYRISTETQYVINEALRIHALSGGMLDVTVGPLVNLWGFGPDKKPETLPTPEQLSDISDFVGIDKFTLNNNIVTKAHQQVYIDLSTIAKGYAVDEIAELLISHGISNFLVEIGGEMRLSGTKPHDQDWLVAIEKPVTNERSVQRVISIGDNAIASSGDYRNYFEEDGVRYSHLIDPTTAYPIQHNLVSVSVVASKSITADGLATALIVMGKDAGMDMAQANNIAALFVTKEGDEFVEYTTDAFNQRVTVIK